jgi:hypothetical protein
MEALSRDNIVMSAIHTCLSTFSFPSTVTTGCLWSFFLFSHFLFHHIVKGAPVDSAREAQAHRHTSSGKSYNISSSLSEIAGT